MADDLRESSRTRKPIRARREHPGQASEGRARQRKGQREREVDLRQSLSKAVSNGGLLSALQKSNFPNTKSQLLKGVQGTLAGLNPSNILKGRTPRRTKNTVGVAELGSRPRRNLQEKLASRQAAAAEAVVEMAHNDVYKERSTYSQTEEPRLRRARKTASLPQSNRLHVLVRSGMADMAVRKPKPGSTKRRFDIALDVPGAELRLPSLPMVHIGWRLISGLLAVMMIVSLFFLWKSPAFQVNTVEAEGLERLTVGDLNAVMDVLGGSIFSIDPPVLESALQQAFPELASISVSAGLPAHVSVNLTERKPVIAWFQDGREVWVDAEGVAFPPRGNPGTLVRLVGHGSMPDAIASVNIPVTGSIPEGVIYVAVSAEGMLEASGEAVKPATLPLALVEAILTLGSQVPEETQLVYDAIHGLGWEDPLGWEVYFGDQTGDMQQRLVVYQGVVDHLTYRGIQPEFVSVEYPHAPYYRMDR